MKTTIKPRIHTALFLLLISLAGVSYAQIPQIERDALIALYNSTGGAQASKANWAKASLIWIVISIILGILVIAAVT